MGGLQVYGLAGLSTCTQTYKKLPFPSNVSEKALTYAKQILETIDYCIDNQRKFNNCALEVMH